jgi:hypothetical protein
VFSSLGDKTIADYANENIGKLTFPLLSKLFKDENLLYQSFVEVLIQKFAVTLGADKTKDLAKLIVDQLVGQLSYEQTTVHSPVEPRVYSSLGELTGLLHKKVKHEISISVYSQETITTYFPPDTCRYAVVGIDTGTYGFDISSTQDGQTNTFSVAANLITVGEANQYTIDWATYAQTGEGVTLKQE